MMNRERLLAEASEYGLVPYSTLPNITAPGWDCNPLLVERHDDNRHLVSVGVNHRNVPDAENPHYMAVCNAFTDFEIATRGLIRAIVVEGGYRKPFSDPNEGYRQGAEGSLVASLAESYDMAQYCFEPEKYGAEALLRQGFAREHIALYLFGRMVPPWDRRMKAAGLDTHVSFETWVTPKMEAVKAELDWQEFTSYETLTHLYERVYGEPFNTNRETVQSMLEQTVGYMLEPRSPVHEVAIAANRERDIQLALGIAALWQPEHSVFIPYGYLHIRVLQRFIQGLRLKIEA